MKIRLTDSTNGQHVQGPSRDALEVDEGWSPTYHRAARPPTGAQWEESMHIVDLPY